MTTLLQEFEEWLRSNEDAPWDEGFVIRTALEKLEELKAKHGIKEDGSM